VIRRPPAPHCQFTGSFGWPAFPVAGMGTRLRRSSRAIALSHRELVTYYVTTEEVVRRYYELVDRSEFDQLVALFSEDAVYRRPGYEPLIGRGALADFYRGTRVITAGQHRVITVICQDSRVAVQGQFSGTIRGNEPVDLGYADFFAFGADGLIRARDTFFFSPLV
jgi:steroid delta-isomerase